MKKSDREIIFQKFGGRCAYSGTPLEPDWQVDHIRPVRQWCLLYPPDDDPNNIDNLFPCQRIINHYKGGLSLEHFRTWFLGGLHERLKKLPKNPLVERSKRKKEYLLKVASYFGITPDKPFSGKFYFETINYGTTN